jgi:uncharacterized protein (DUF362 family)
MAHNRRLRVLALLAGLVSLVWFLVRVIPKPSRAAYPCQRAAFPLASGFVLWFAGLIGGWTLHRRAAAGLAVLTLALLLVWIPLGVPGDAAAQGPAAEPFKPSEPLNAPMGEGKGIHPGRVAWVRDPDATSWDGATGNWWDEAATNQAAVERMSSTALERLTGEKTDRQAWEALFRHFNRTHQSGNSGYRRGEKIAIKINANQDRSPEWGKAASRADILPGRPAGAPPGMGRVLNGLHSPQLVYWLVAQLITAAGVPGEDITIYDATVWRNIGQPIYAKIRANSSPAFRAVRFVVGDDWGTTGRSAPVADDANPIRFSRQGVPAALLPRQVTDAKYLINLALLRPHGMAGITLTAKNHFGSVHFAENGGWVPRALHNFISRTQPMGSYNPLVDLTGHRHLGGKTLLYMLDGLYAAESNEGNVFRFASLGDDWSSSVLMSQDPVAIDSVGLDILRSEPKATQVRGNADNYLHEAALAAKPPSGTVYDPEGDGKPLASLGVHEHWNNAAERKYSRNLGRKDGIELIAVTGAAKP